MVLANFLLQNPIFLLFFCWTLMMTRKRNSGLIPVCNQWQIFVFRIFGSRSSHRWAQRFVWWCSSCFKRWQFTLCLARSLCQVVWHLNQHLWLDYWIVVFHQATESIEKLVTGLESAWWFASFDVTKKHPFYSWQQSLLSWHSSNYFGDASNEKQLLTNQVAAIQLALAPQALLQ